MSLFMTIRLTDEEIRVDLDMVAGVIRDYGKQVDDRARLVLEQEGKNSTGNLSESIQHQVSMADDQVVIILADSCTPTMTSSNAESRVS